MPTDYDFSETSSSITLTFYIPPHSSEDRVVELIDPSTLLYNGERLALYRPVHSLTIERLKHCIEATLQKETPGKWYSIDGSGSRVVATEYTEEEKEETPQDLMGLLSNIYSTGSDDVKRAMNKSLYESGGTVLSTDWEKVSKKKVEPESKQ